MAPLGKNQQTLSSFFKKPASTSKVKTSVVATFDRPNGVENEPEEDIFEPAPKRRRLSPETSHGNRIDFEDSETSTKLKDIAPNGRTSRPLPNRGTPAERTSKYLFSASPLRENQEPESTDDADKQRRENLHRRFVKKLGRPDSIADIKRRNRVLDGEGEGDGEQAEDEDDPEEALASTNGRAKGKKTGKLTPMEKQIIDIKKANMDTMLAVEVGYKYRFFGEDAHIAAKELGFMCIPGKRRFDEHPSEAHLNRFAGASFPTERLHIHVKRLVAAGHKVGVVRQIETAALKAVGDNRNTPFVRKLTNLYTKGTYIDDLEGVEEGGTSPPPESPATGFLLCLTEVNVKASGNDEEVHVGLIAVQPATGEVVYDDFEDGFMRSDIETRLLHIAPCEFLIVGDVSRATDKLVMHLAGTRANVLGDRARIERVNKHKTTAAEAHSHVSNFYADRLKSTPDDDGKSGKILDKILGLPENVVVCLSAMITHMTEYGLEHVFDLTKYFQPFSGRSRMLLNGNTLSSLEVYQNQTDHTTTGSLLWSLDRTQTKFGSRLLRKWVGRPLLERNLIEARLTAIDELLDGDKTGQVQKLRQVLGKLRTDLEKSLIRIYYGKCTRSELVTVLQSLQYLASEYAHVKDENAAGFDSTLISAALVSLPFILTEVVAYLERINLDAARSNDKYAFFREEHGTELIDDHKEAIASIEHDLEEFRKVAAETLGRSRPVEYVTSSAIEFLIEVENTSTYIKRVPASWAKISGTKKLSRFHPPEVIKLIKERDQHKESLAAACDSAYRDLLADISTKYQLFRDTIQSLATLDCLLSLATIASQPGYTRPTFTNTTQLNIHGARHPMVEQLLLSTYVPNDISLATSNTRALLVTGPNMGGKSSYVRSIALIAIMAQIGSYVPCDSAELGILDAVFTRMGAFDKMMSGESTFMVELSETSDILKLATERSLVVLDELGRGTSTHDGMAIASSVLDYLVRDKKCLTLFITHYQTLARLEAMWPGGELRNVHMRFQEEGRDEVTFLYEVGVGVAHRSYGLNVARLAGLGGGVIEVARGKSLELERVVRGRRLRGVGRALLGEEVEVDVERLVEGIEEL